MTFLKNLFKNLNMLTVSGLIIIFFLVLIAILAPLIAPYDPLAVEETVEILSPGTQGHVLGTDSMGRDILSRLIFGTRVSLGLGVFILAICLVVGIPMGLISGFYGGWIDQVIMRIVDILYSFPFLILAITVMSILGSNWINLALVIGIIGWSYYARLVRGMVLSIKESEYILAAKALGINDFHILFRHILPNCLGPLVVAASFDIGKIILAISSLSFLGLGVPEPTPEWGNMLKLGVDYLIEAPHMSLVPGIAMMIAILSFNLVGEGLKDV
jgi:peptide/nickel transport system permease protein